MIYVGTLDQGVFYLEDNDWIALGGPSDVVELDWHRGGLSIGSGTRGLWRVEGDMWSQIGTSAVVDIEGDLALDFSGNSYILSEGEADEPIEKEPATVHIAISFHGNYYHSYRGDTPDNDGFGLDIDVIRNTLDWLDEHPEVYGNWDFDNAFTTDDWMLEYSPDIRERIRERVQNGQDEVRLMSWNNGAVTASNHEEFSQSMQRAIQSNTEAFGDVVLGVQPQECMFSPDHLAWYPEQGIEWVTLFYAANGFSALRADITLNGAELYNPITLTDPTSDHSMIAVPAYHHADLLEHGGLLGWAKQISASADQDTLLLIHFDADAETWERFDQELAAVAELDFIEWTTVSKYLYTHEPVSSHEFLGDVADGTGDGFQSWAEKDANHRLFSKVAQARRFAEYAKFIAPNDGEISQMLEDAIEPRLLSLSTTNYGLAAPYLHEDRTASGNAQADEAIQRTQQALEIAIAQNPLSEGSIAIYNARNVSGPALLEFSIKLPTGTWQGNNALHLKDGSGSDIPCTILGTTSDDEYDILDVRTVFSVTALSNSELIWNWDPDIPVATGGLQESDLLTRKIAGTMDDMQRSRFYRSNHSGEQPSQYGKSLRSCANRMGCTGL